MIMQNSYKLVSTCINDAEMLCGSHTHIAELVHMSYKLVQNRQNLLIIWICRMEHIEQF